MGGASPNGNTAARVSVVSHRRPGCRTCFLLADGLDTLAEVSLNGKALGKTENMFRTYRWDVAGLVRAGSNELRILFHSAVNYCLARNAEKPLTPKKGMSLEGGVFVRKAPCHFGWDWGPNAAAHGGVARPAPGRLRAGAR